MWGAKAVLINSPVAGRVVFKNSERSLVSRGSKCDCPSAPEYKRKNFIANLAGRSLLTAIIAQFYFDWDGAGAKSGLAYWEWLPGGRRSFHPPGGSLVRTANRNGACPRSYRARSIQWCPRSRVLAKWESLPCRSPQTRSVLPRRAACASASNKIGIQLNGAWTSEERLK